MALNRVLDLTAQSLDTTFARRVAPDWEQLLACMQCGSCTASCPTAYAMDYTPRQIIRMIQVGLEKEVLGSETIWICASCYSCAVRCPRDIHITDLMASLRSMAIKKGYGPLASVAYNRTFMDIVRRYGRMFEPELIIRYNLGLNPLKLIGQARVGLAMLRKGKLSLAAEKSGGLDEVREIFARAKQGGGER
ncbi:MAG: 4Fe-4S dicluster domain-containing protein [Anaerolineae bacterium]